MRKVDLTMPSYSFPYIFFRPQAPYPWITFFEESLRRMMRRPFFSRNLSWEAIESALTPTTDAPSEVKSDRLSEKAFASFVQPLVPSFG